MRHGVRHQCRVGLIEHAGVDQQLLPAAVLLGRGADHLQGQVQVTEGAVSISGSITQRERGAHGGGGDEVMPAAMPDAGQCVVLDAERHGEGPLPQRRGERGGQAGAALDSEPGLLQQRRGAGARPMLLERGLRVLVQGQAVGADLLAASAVRLLNTVEHVRRRPRHRVAVLL